ncbi:MAG: hypothetical protein JXR04_09230 [Bermanella sp.]
MMKTSIHWLMIVLIALQSIGSMADTHSAHQSGVEHLEFEHAHDNTEPLSASHDTGTQTDFDCHHCCHCHGAHSSFITSFYVANTLFGQSPQHSFANALTLAQHPQSLIAPSF